MIEQTVRVILIWDDLLRIFFLIASLRDARLISYYFKFFLDK